MEYLKVYASGDLVRAVKLAAAEAGISESELCRRLLRRQLGLEAAHSTVPVIQEAVRGILRDELAPVRRLAFIAAFESAVGRGLAEDALAQLVLTATGRREQAAESLAKSVAAARAAAAKRVRVRNPERDAAGEDEDEDDAIDFGGGPPD